VTKLTLVTPSIYPFIRHEPREHVVLSCSPYLPSLLSKGIGDIADGLSDIDKARAEMKAKPVIHFFIGVPDISAYNIGRLSLSLAAIGQIGPDMRCSHCGG
jgi:hypothetical protein